ncbi:MAG: primosomal protein N' [Deltaproteobacteria bacterium]|nr:primosomal protein N' [Deltaproteobacteria bacterium]
MPYLEVAAASPIYHTLTYRSPAACKVPLQAGLRLLVPLGSRQITGYLLTVSDIAPTAKYKIREITDILDQQPLFPGAMVKFFRWLADYYQYPIGEIIKAALPGGLTPQSSRRISLTAAGREFFHGTPAAQISAAWFASLLDRGELPAAAVKSLWRRQRDRNIARQWEAKGFINIHAEISQDRVRDKTELCVRLVHDGSEPAGLKKSEEKTMQALARLSQATNQNWIARRDLNRVYAGSGRAIAGLVVRKLIITAKQPVYRNPFGETPPSYPKPRKLTADQEQALAGIAPALAAAKFTTFLLHGITGSGKTEVYLRAAELALQAGKGVLIMVPEIALATQIEGNFLARFGSQTALLHSGLSKGERLDQWKRIASGAAKIVIGARSALFAPLADPGLIVVDEEHDGSYKQEDGFCYQARDAAVLRGRQSQAVVILGSATPSVISYQHARQGKYQLLSMPSRVANRSLPKVEIIDLRAINTVNGRPPLFTPQLTRALRDNLRQKDQSLIFLNRRGYANLMICQDCGYTLQCPNCQVSLTLHKNRRELVCHYCGAARHSEAVCPKCQSTKLKGMGFGTERIEDELRHMMPKARIARLDRDSAVNRRQYMKILQAVHHHEIDILVGTQMIAKGHHFPLVTLVGVVWADASLGIPDYKAGERTFQLLTQVLGRAGRGETPGRVLVQTHHPEHYSIINARTHNYGKMFSAEISLRQALKFPPFCRLINLRFSGENEAAVKEAARQIAQTARSKLQRDLEILGPAPAPLSRLRGQFRWHLLLKGQSWQDLHRLSRHLKEISAKPPFPRRVKLTVDVDPENML